MVVKSVNFTHMTSCPNQGLSQLLSERHTWLPPSAGYLHSVDVCYETASVMCVYVLTEAHQPSSGVVEDIRPQLQKDCKDDNLMKKV